MASQSTAARITATIAHATYTGIRGGHQASRSNGQKHWRGTSSRVMSRHGDTNDNCNQAGY